MESVIRVQNLVEAVYDTPNRSELEEESLSEYFLFLLKPNGKDCKIKTQMHNPEYGKETAILIHYLLVGWVVGLVV